MPITYWIDETVTIIREEWSGDVSAEDLGDHWRRYLADPRVMMLRRTLVDLRNGIPAFTGTQLRDLITRIVDPVLKGRDWRTAIVVDTSPQFGTSRQYQVFAEHYSRDAIFHDLESAAKWLLRI